MKINWKVRLKNKTFWILFIPALLILIQTVATLFGVSLDLSELQGKLLAIVEAVFVLVGVIVDPTTKGISDGAIGLTYDEPA